MDVVPTGALVWRRNLLVFPAQNRFGRVAERERVAVLDRSEAHHAVDRNALARLVEVEMESA